MLRAVIIGCSIIAGTAVAVPYLMDRSGGAVFPSAASDAALPAVAAASSVSGRRVHMEADGRGHFIGEFRINGRAVEAMIDTGASVVAINRTTARRVGISVAPSDFRHPVATANGTAMAASARIDRLEIGGIAVRDVRALIMDDAALSGTLVGMSFLNNLRRYQVENGRLLLEQ